MISASGSSQVVIDRSQPLVSAILAYLDTWAWLISNFSAITVWVSLIGVVMFGTLAGAMLPFILRKLGFDPATSSAPFVATLVDVTGLVIYFTVAFFIMRGTLL